MAKTKYTFDLANRLLTETNPITRVTTFTYDAAGNRQTKLDANGHLTTYAYDDNRRLTRVDFDDGTAYEYGFDSRGNRTLEKGPSHERHLHFDGLNRLDVVDDVTFGKQLAYGYDAVGNRTSLAEGGVTQRWEYDARNMLAAARVGSGARTLFGYDADGRRRFVARPNGVRTDYAFDEARQLLSMTHSKGGNVLLGFGYAYDGRGNRVSKTREDGTAEVYGYDSSMRLTQVDYGTAKTVEYSLDALGNRTNEVQTIRPAVGSNVVTSFNGTYNLFNQQLTRNRSGGGLPALSTAFAYDNNGNTLTETAGSAVTSYTWDRDNRLRAVTPPAPGVATQYAYDANGLRMQRVDSTGTTRYLLDGPSVLAELDGLNAATTRYLSNPQNIDEVISYERSGATYWPVTDGLGSWYAVTDSSGALAHRFDFDVYGARTDLGGAGPAVDVGFTGQRHDANGLMGIGVRPYLPRTGVWLEPDRAGMIDGPNIYTYVKNAPTMYVDPTGFLTVDYGGFVGVCSASSSDPLGLGTKFQRALRWAQENAATGPYIDALIEDGQPPLIQFEPGLVGVTGFGATELGFPITTNKVTSVGPIRLSIKTIEEKDIDFIAHVIVHEIGHYTFWNSRVGNFLLPWETSRIINGASERSYKDPSYASTPSLPTEGYQAERSVFGEVRD